MSTVSRCHVFLNVRLHTVVPCYVPSHGLDYDFLGRKLFVSPTPIGTKPNCRYDSDIWH